MTTSQPDADLVSLLSMHERVKVSDLRRDLRQHCSCGWVGPERVGVSAHRTHLADVLAPYIAEQEAAALEAAADSAERSDPVGLSQFYASTIARWLRDRAAQHRSKP